MFTQKQLFNNDIRQQTKNPNGCDIEFDFSKDLVTKSFHSVGEFKRNHLFLYALIFVLRTYSVSAGKKTPWCHHIDVVCSQL